MEDLHEPLDLNSLTEEEADALAAEVEHDARDLTDEET